MTKFNIFKSKRRRLQKKVDNFNRKLIHIASAIIIVFFPYFFSLNQIIFISLLFALLFVLARVFGFLRIINGVERSTWGEIFYPLGVMITAILFLPNNIPAFQFGVLVLGVSDALANIFGGLFGSFKFRAIGGIKSIEGSFVFFCSTFILVVLFQGGYDNNFLPHYLIVSAILTVVEFVLFFGLDNLFLPVLGAYLFTLI